MRGMRGTREPTPRVYGARSRWKRRAGDRARECRLGGQRAWGAAHVKHGIHVRDAGCVPAQGLVEGVRVLPRVASRAHGEGRAASREAAGTGRGVHVQRVPGEKVGRRRDCRLAGRIDARGAAHLKHVLHVRDAGGIPAQRLVEGPRGLPRVASRAQSRCGVGCGSGGGRRRGELGAGSACTERAGERAPPQVTGGQGAGSSAH